MPWVAANTRRPGLPSGGGEITSCAGATWPYNTWIMGAPRPWVGSIPYCARVPTVATRRDVLLQQPSWGGLYGLLRHGNASVL